MGACCTCDTFKPEHGAVQVIAAANGIDLRGDDGQPFHCGARMRTWTGITGTDLAKCETCGLTIADGLSPHINGGYVMADAVFDAHPDGAWAVLEAPR